MDDLTRRYLIDVKPHHLETLSSYSARLSTANFEDVTHQRYLARLGQARNPTGSPEENWANIVAAKSGRDVSRLRLPCGRSTSRSTGSSGIRSRETTALRIACTLCTHGDTVWQHPHFEGNICVKHHRWVGPLTGATQQHAVGIDAVRAELRFRKLRRKGRIDAPLYFALNNLLRPIASTAGLTGPAGDSAIYPQLVALAGLLTSIGFGRRFFNPAHTFAEAYAFLTTTIREVLGGRPDLIRAIWLYLRPTFLSIRESILTGLPYQAASDQDFTVTAAITGSLGAPPRPLEPFNRYLRASGDSEITPDNAVQVLIPVPLSNTERDLPYKAITALCPVGHRFSRPIIEIRKLAARGTEQCGFCAHTSLLPGFNDLATTHPDLAREFSPKNLPRTAEQIFAGSARTFWWRCAKGHDFEATASNRSAARSGCPICLNRVIVPGVNDIATLHPHLVAEFHPDKNINHRLETLAAGTNILLWWHCNQGHTFRASLGSRTRGAGCHYCASRSAGRRTIASVRPDLAAEWHPNNYPLTPEDVTIGSRKDIEWLCAQGHSYIQRPERRNVGYGCFICSGRKLARGVNDAMTRYPEICAEWHPSKNCFKDPSDLLPGTALYWWKCKAEGHVTHQSIPHRVESNGCTMCPPTARVTARTP